MKTFINRTNILLFVMLVIVQACGALPQADEELILEEPIVVQSTQPVDVESEEPALPVPQSNVVPVNLPEAMSGHASDQVSALDKAISGGDRFTFGQFERPFNSEKMDVYYPSLDIVDTIIYQDDEWVYGIIQLSSLEETNLVTGKYALELDTDRDGRGDWLVLVAKPASTDWTVQGVQIYYDENDDVGNVSAMYTDEATDGDGFESLFFDQGTGADSETAWVRTSPVNPDAVEISVKRQALGIPNSFMVNMWAGTSLLDPSHFDLNDFFTHEQAGAANPGFELYYPIKSVFELDNSCRLAIGFQPIGTEPGLCKTLVPVNPAEPSEPYSAPNLSCEPCPEGATGQKPYPDCRCTFPIIR